MPCVIQVTRPRSEYDELCDRQRREPDARARLRMTAVIARWDGERVSDTARFLKVNRASVKNWVKRFNAEGIEGLYDRPRSGRRRKIDWDQLHDDLLKSPTAFDYPVQGWTVDIVVDHIKCRYGVEYHPRHIYWLVKQIGFSFLVPRPRNYASNQDEVEDWKKT